MSTLEPTDKALKELRTLLPFCRLGELERYSRSHLWVNPSGELRDLAFSEIVSGTWGEQGWLYDLQDDEDRERVYKTLNLLEHGLMRTQEDALHKLSNHPLWSTITQDYLNLLFKFLISELLMNTIRYDRGHTERETRDLYQGVKHQWDRFVYRILDMCQVRNNSPDVASLRVSNMMCILIMYLQEAMYTGTEEKKARGKWGKALWTLLGQKIQVLDLRGILSAEALQQAHERILSNPSRSCTATSRGCDQRTH
ncbi:hypothetical protein BGX38DRAFT_783441 [Terfezia claveryi]|nr:hypothetical protein BGX38DRAFT_783441 [Terfezia claveryi]